MQMNNLREKIKQGVSKGVTQAILRHKNNNQSIIVYHNEKIIEVPAEQIDLSSAGKFQEKRKE